VQLDQALGQRQAEAGALVAPGQRVVDLAERLQRHDDLFRIHADADIGDGERNAAAGRSARG
jgi:hypothetical protein